MVSSSVFYQLTYTQQADVLLQKGTFLQSRFEDSFVVDLYELDDLLVEVFYEKGSEELVSVMAYNTDEKLKTLVYGNLKPRLTIKNPAPFAAVKENFAA